MEASLQLECDQIDPSLMDTDHPQRQQAHPSDTNGHQDPIHVHDGERDNSRHFGRLLDAIHIGSKDNDFLPDVDHQQQWQQSPLPAQKQVIFLLLLVLLSPLIHFVCSRDLKNGSGPSPTLENLELSLS